MTCHWRPRRFCKRLLHVEGQLNELQQERDKVTQAFTPAHPMVIALDRQIERLNGELGQLNEQVRELPNTQQEVLRLVRDVEVNTVLYTSLLNTAQELRVVKAGTVGNVRVVDYAVTAVRASQAEEVADAACCHWFSAVLSASQPRLPKKP